MEPTLSVIVVEKNLKRDKYTFLEAHGFCLSSHVPTNYFRYTQRRRDHFQVEEDERAMRGRRSPSGI